MKQLIGTVIHTKMAKTAVVAVVRRWTHPVYRKTLTKRKKYLAHCEDKNIKIGAKVVIQETKPISKRKKWQVVKKL